MEVRHGALLDYTAQSHHACLTKLFALIYRTSHFLLINLLLKINPNEYDITPECAVNEINTTCTQYILCNNHRIWYKNDVLVFPGKKQHRFFLSQVVLVTFFSPLFLDRISSATHRPWVAWLWVSQDYWNILSLPNHTKPLSCLTNCLNHRIPCLGKAWSSFEVCRSV